MDGIKLSNKSIVIKNILIELKFVV